MMPHDLPPWHTVYQQTQRWRKAGGFESTAHDLRMRLHMATDRNPTSSAAVLDSRTLQSTQESGGCAGYDGAKRRKGSKVHLAVDTLGHLLALHVTPANEQDREQVARLAQTVQEVTGGTVEAAFVDHGYTGKSAQRQAQDDGIDLVIYGLPTKYKGLIDFLATWDKPAVVYPASGVGSFVARADMESASPLRQSIQAAGKLPEMLSASNSVGASRFAMMGDQSLC
jgi:transposase